jgi:hypothetical protein
LKGCAVALLARFDYLSANKLFSHHHRRLDERRLIFLPKSKTTDNTDFIREIRGQNVLSN